MTDNFIKAIVISIGIDKAGIMWFGTLNGRIKFDGQAWEKVEVPNNGYLKNIPIWTIAFDKENKKWIGIFGAGILTEN